MFRVSTRMLMCSSDEPIDLYVSSDGTIPAVTASGYNLKEYCVFCGSELVERGNCKQCGGPQGVERRLTATPMSCVTKSHYEDEEPDLEEEMYEEEDDGEEEEGDA